MRTGSRRYRSGVRVLLAAAAVAASCTHALAQAPAAPPPAASEPAMVRPGSPGTPSRALTPDDLSVPSRSRHSEADVAFMRNMILHHGQALVMSALVPQRTQREDIRRLALRIELSQDAEIALMQRWLARRGEQAPEPGSAHAHHGHPVPEGEGMMAGMLTEAQLASLAAAEGAAFDRLFLELMIRHHEGALAMVAELFGSPGGALDSDVYGFASEVSSDQLMEITRMRAMLGGGS